MRFVERVEVQSRGAAGEQRRGVLVDLGLDLQLELAHGVAAGVAEAEVAESTTSSNSDENPEDTLNYVRSVLDKKDINTQSQLAAEESASSNEVEATASASTEVEVY